MFEISKNGIIKVNRGDNFTIPLFIDQGTEMNPIIYEMNDKDHLYLGIMEPNQPFEFAIVRKKYSCDVMDEEGMLHLPFIPEDTECLIPGLYYYQVKLNKCDPLTEEYKVNTVIKKQQFYILE